MPLTDGPSSSAVMRSETRARPRARSAMKVTAARDEGGDAALHVDRAAAMDEAAVDLAREGRMGPAGRVAGRHDVDMAGEDEVRRPRPMVAIRLATSGVPGAENVTRSVRHPASPSSPSR